ncbi:MAG: hypothetical protein DRI46_13575, partial [Chloroflexi bacterium]
DVGAFAEANPQEGGFALECSVHDSSENLYMTKTDGQVDFYRMSFISGHVFDGNGSPLEGIGVDTAEGGYGTCTDEFGSYTLSNLPEGTYDIAAGRDFCGEHPFEEQVLTDVSTGSTGVDFNLVEGRQIDTTAQPDHDWVFSFGWTIGDLITLNIDEFTLTQTAMEAEWQPEFGYVQFDDFDSFDLTPGMPVEVYDETYTDILVVEMLTIDFFDEATKTAGGTAPGAEEGREVGVGAHQPGYDFWTIATVDEFGNWFADFSDDLTPMQDVEDIHAMIWDDDGDATQANFEFPQTLISGHVYDSESVPLGGIVVQTDNGEYNTCTNGDGYYELNLPEGTYDIAAGRFLCGDIPPYEEQMVENVPTGSTDIDFHLVEIIEIPEPYISAQPEHEWVGSNGWMVGDLITLNLDIDPELANGYELTLTQLATPEEGNPEIGRVNFDDFTPYDLAPGMLVEITDGTQTKILLVELITFDSLDQTAKIAGGTAPPERELGVGIPVEGYFFWMVVTSDEFGNWEADFSSDPNPINDTVDVFAQLWDEDGDSTVAHYEVPEPLDVHIYAYLDSQSIYTTDWDAGSILDLYLDGVLVQTKPVIPFSGDPSKGYVTFSGWDPVYALSPDTTIIITDGLHFKSYLVESLEITGINEFTNEVYGTAPAGRDLEVGIFISGVGNHSVNITVESDGTWSAIFPDLFEASSITAYLFDDDHDGTIIRYFP